MTLENRIERRGRQVLSSPLWLGLLITAFLAVSMLFTPEIPLWVSINSFITLLPLVLGSTYLADYVYRRAVGSDESDASSPDPSVTEEESQTPIERLRHAYATGEINEETFEQRLSRLLETEDIETRQHRSSGVNAERDLITE